MELTTPNILIIDDSPDFYLLASQLISIKWPDVEIEYYNPETEGELNDNFDTSHFDCILLDNMLGEWSGLDWLKKLRRQSASPPVVYVTATGNEKIAASAIKLGAMEYLRKEDITKQSLVDIIESSIESARQQSEQLNKTQELVLEEKTEEDLTNVRREKNTHRFGLHISGFNLLEKIGEGGMARVFLAKTAENNLQIVLKVLNTSLWQDTDFLERFIREHEVISQIDNPFIIKIYDIGFNDEHAYISMELLSGGDLKKRCRENPKGMPPLTALNIYRDLLIALQGIHNAGVIHRDLKPQNIMFRADDSLALADFGLAKQIDDSMQLTLAGHILGTPNYMSPEQGQGRDLDTRSDLYSSGIILYEMLTGKPPFSGRDVAAVIFQHCHETLPPLPKQLINCQPLLNKLLAKKVEDRYANTDEALQATELLLASFK